MEELVPGGVPSSMVLRVRGWMGSVNSTRTMVVGSTSVAPEPGVMTGLLLGGGVRMTSGVRVSSPTVAQPRALATRYLPLTARTAVEMLMRIWLPLGKVSWVERSSSVSTTKTRVFGDTRRVEPSKFPSVPGKPTPGVAPSTSSATGLPVPSRVTQVCRANWGGSDWGVPL